MSHSCNLIRSNFFFNHSWSDSIIMYSNIVYSTDYQKFYLTWNTRYGNHLYRTLYHRTMACSGVTLLNLQYSWNNTGNGNKAFHISAEYILSNMTNILLPFYSRGEVCTLEPLHINRNIADHPLRDRHLLAMGTLTKVRYRWNALLGTRLYRYFCYVSGSGCYSAASSQSLVFSPTQRACK